MIPVHPKQSTVLRLRQNRMSGSTQTCMCSNFKVIVWFLRHLGLFPLVPCVKSPYHSINGCHFNVSKRYIVLSVVIQIVFLPNIVWLWITYIWLPADDKIFIRKLQLYNPTLVTVDVYIDLLCAIIYANRLCVIFKRLSVIPSSFKHMKSYGKNTTRIMFLTLACASTGCLTWTIASCTYLPFFTVNKYYIDTALERIAVILLALISIMQSFVTVLICLFIASKFENLAIRIEHYLQQMSNVPQLNQVMSGCTTLQEISCHHRILHECMTEANNCFRCQLLMAMMYDWFILIYYLYRKLIDSKFNDTIYAAINGDIFIILITLRLTLLICTGQIIKSKSERPLLVLQTTEVLYLPEYVQQQVRTLLLQWMNKKPIYLAAFNIVHVGPWLVAPVIGSIITYLIVFMQYGQLN